MTNPLEVKTLNNLPHPKIVKCLGAFPFDWNNRQLGCIVLQHCPKGPLGAWLRQNPNQTVEFKQARPPTYHPRPRPSRSFQPRPPAQI